MSRNAKIILIVGVIALCVCLVGSTIYLLRAAGKAFEQAVDSFDDPEAAAELARSMVDYDLPPGYQEASAINFGFVKMVMINTTNDWASDAYRPTITIAQMPANAAMDEEDARQQVQQSMRSSMRLQNFDMQLVEEQVKTIRDQEVTLFIYAGVYEGGMEMKQLVSDLFEGKNGQIMLTIMGPEDGWDQEEIDAFLESIH